MSEKRFSETERNCYYTSLVFDNQTQEELGTNKAVKLLNALHEENEQLQAKLDFHLSLAETKIKNREKENKQLRQINENYINIINHKIQELEETNVVMLLPRESVQVLNSLKKELLDDE